MKVVNKGRGNIGNHIMVEANEIEQVIADVIIARLNDGLSGHEECRRWAKHFFDIGVHKGWNKPENWTDWQQYCGLDT
jgi:hypothetical protein